MAMIVCTALSLREEHFSVLRRYPSDADALGFSSGQRTVAAAFEQLLTPPIIGIFLVTFIGYFLVGSGSFAFHATLK